MTPYFRPPAPYFVGDCMPFFHEGTFHLFYLIDENHHQGLGGLGGHQWAHASTTDLQHWEHHPLAIAITDEREGSICTGSTFFHEGTFYGFYATRLRDWTQHLSLATSTDGIHFTKVTPNPLLSPPPAYGANDFRDPFVFRDASGRFQMLLTSLISSFPLHDLGGCLLRLSSDNLYDWHIEEPFLIPGGPIGYKAIPECPDYFYWNGWYYLIFGLGLQTHYRLSRNPFGPWHRPANDTLGNGLLAVMKTAPFGTERRIGVGWLGTRHNDKDSEPTQWGGNVVFREILQQPDGTLGTAFVPEMLPERGEPIMPTATVLTGGITDATPEAIAFAGSETQEVAFLSPLPRCFHLTCRVVPGTTDFAFGLGLRGSGAFETYYPLTISPTRRSVTLAGERIDCIKNLDSPFTLEVIARDDILDVCIAGKRCLINRLNELTGDRLFFFAESAAVAFEDIRLHTLVQRR